MSPLGRPDEPGSPAPRPNRPVEPTRPRAPVPTPPPAASTGSLPERMKASKALAGRICPACQGPIVLGADVWNCGSCSTPHHAPCHEQAGSCMAEDCPAAEAPPPGAGGETKACPYCGETVLKAAKKCKHCREILSPALRAARERQVKGGDPKIGRDALIYGIVGLLICQPIFGPIAIVKGVESRKKDIDAGMGTAGLILGILDVLLFVVVLIPRLSVR